jgi:putative ABC transport system permease protein
MRNWRQEVERRLPEAHQAGVVQELAVHLADRYEELRAAGASDEEAYQAVITELDQSEQLEHELAVMARHRPPPVPLGAPPLAPHRRLSMFADIWQDVRFAARMLRKSPGFAAVVVVTLALGIGANTAIFTVINAVMLRPLPFDDPDRLVRIYESNPARGWPIFGVSHPNFLDWVSDNKTFDHIGAMVNTSFTLASGTETERVTGIAVSHRFLPALGATPVIGRNFLPEEDRPGGNRLVAILTHGFWQRQFGGDPNVLERTIVLTTNTYRVIGVLPEQFGWGDASLAVVVPLAADPARSRGDHRLLVIGRMKAGISLDTAFADMKTIASRLEQQYPESNRDWTVGIDSFYEWLVPEESRQSLLVFGAAVIALLLIACSNVASLMLARATGRDREISVRLALGARQGRLVRQLLVEALLLSAIAGVAGFLVAVGSMQLLRSLSPGTLPRLDEISIDQRVMLFGLVTSLATGVLFGLLPALSATRVDVNETLKEGTRTGSAGPSRQRVRHALVIAELALSVALLVAGGLLLRSFMQMQQVSPGFDTSRLLTLRLNLPPARYDTNAKAWEFYSQLLQRASALPGVSGVAMTSGVPLSGGGTAGEVHIPGRTSGTEADAGSADWRIVSPGYFKTMGIPLRGREFTPADNPKSQLVTIISEAAAARYWPGEDPIGKLVILGSFGKEPLVVVGVAGDVRSAGLDTVAAPAVYFPTPGAAMWNPMNIVVRSAVDPASLVPSMRAVLREVDSGVPFYDIRTGDEWLDQSMGPRRFTMILIACFAVVALILASVGLFGVMAYLVTQRTREIGIRLALGAHPREVFKLVLSRGLLLAIIGVTIGIGAAYQFSPLLEELLFEVKTLDPVTFIVAPLVLVVVALVASYLPARRAMRVDPLHALRHD